MPNKMIIDASHPEETRVVVLRGNRVEEFDFESASKRPLRGNIYLAKVTRVEPSLQAAFIDYGGNRHGFLAFSEIHPDYYQIPVADRQALLEEEALSQREEDDEPNGERRSRRHRRPRQQTEARAGEEIVWEPATDGDAEADETESVLDRPPSHPNKTAATLGAQTGEASPGATAPPDEFSALIDSIEPRPVIAQSALPADEASEPAKADRGAKPGAEIEPRTTPDPTSEGLNGEPHEAKIALDQRESEERPHDDDHEVTTLESGAEERVASSREPSADDEDRPVEQVGGDALEEVPPRPQRFRRQYKIQEVIKRRQVLLVQVVKEERGNKGAALTTYLSLAGRYSVLMPNTARGGGISRKITNAQDRSRLKAIAEDLDVPEGMGVILRTAGASRTKAEVKRDFEYLLRMWETVRETTLASSAPTLVYEEGSLIKRAIRDLYSKEVEEIVVAGEAGYQEAKEFMRLLMPSHVNCVHLYRDTQPVFAKSGVESQLDAMFSNQVTLKSGGYIVINQTEALVAIDVNSGRSTREHNIEDTALRTNLEAADEIARQLRLRDLAGLIVVDFIDMEESRNNRAVERRIKEALKNDRARIQVGRISHFGLLEMSRQRIRTGVIEGSTVVCPHCQGAGVVRSTASIALHVLRALEDALIKSSTHDVVVRTRSPVALYILNHKRSNLRDLERRFGVTVVVEGDDTLTGANYHAIERGEQATGVKGESETLLAPAHDLATVVDEATPIEEPREHSYDEGASEPAESERDSEGAEPPEEMDGRRRRRRRRRRGGDRSHGERISPDAPQPTDDGLAVMAEIGGDLPAATSDANDHDAKGPRGESERQRRPRRSRGGRNRFAPRPVDDGGRASSVLPEAETDDSPSVAMGADSPQYREEATSGAPQAAEASIGVSPEPDPAAMASAEVGASPPAAPEAQPVSEELPRPRRSGWWQKARASIVGE